MTVYHIGQPVEADIFVRGPASALARAAAVGATTITVYDASRWSAAHVLKLGDGDPQMTTSEIRTIDTGGITGNVITLTAALSHAHAAGTPVARILDATLVATLEAPNGADTTPTASNVSTGRYRIVVTPDQSGDHDLEVVASGAATGAGVTTFSVVTDRIA